MIGAIISIVAAVGSATAAVATGVIFFQTKAIRDKYRKWSDIKKTSHIYYWEAKKNDYGDWVVAGGSRDRWGNNARYPFRNKGTAIEMQKWLSSAADTRTYPQVMADCETKYSPKEVEL